MDWIELERFRVDCVLGVHDAERKAEQPLEIELGLGLDLDAAGDMDDLGNSVDYAAACADVSFVVKAGRFRLLETLAVVLSRHFLSPPAPGEGRTAVEAVKVALRKPEVLGGKAVPGIVVERKAKWRKVATRTPGEGVRVEVLAETTEGGAYRVLLAKGARYSVSAPVEIRVVAGHVSTDADSLEPGEQATWSGAQALVSGDDGAALLLVARPPLPRSV